MIHLTRDGLLAGLLVLPSIAWADSPRLTGTSPLGIQRGLSTEVTFEGSGLGDGTRLIAPFDFEIEEPTGSEPGATRWQVRLTADARTAVGVYPVRVVTDSGISNPILFAVGQLPQIAEAEPNDAAASAQEIPNPIVVEGECPGNDLDFFRFPGREGDRIVVDALCARVGTELDPMIRLTTADGRLVASANDHPGLVTDCYLTAVLPEDGEYVLEICDSRFAGAGRTGYRLLIGAVPFAGEVHPLALPRGQDTALALRGGTLSIDGLFALRTPSDPLCSMFQPAIPARLLGDPAWADSELDVELPAPVALGSPVAVPEPADPAQQLPPLSPPVTVLGRLSAAGERDEFTITAPPGSRHEVRVEAWGLGSALDGQLRIFGGDGSVLGESDDGKPSSGRRSRRSRGPTSPDPSYDLTIPDGQDEVRIVVKDLADRGGVGFTYRLVVEPAAPSFGLTFEEGQVAVPRGGTALIPVTVTRSGYDGPVALDLRGIPDGSGVTVLPGTVPAGQTSGVVGLEAVPEGEPQVREIQVVGSGDDGQAVVASGTTVFAQQTLDVRGFGMSGTIPSYSRPVVSLTAAVIGPGPILLASERPRFVVPQGCAIDVPLQVVQVAEREVTYRIAALSSPDGLSVEELDVDGGESTAEIELTAAADATPGPYQVGLVARPSGSEGPPVAAALIKVEVVPPASLELPGGEIAIAPAGSVAIEGKVARVEPFAGPVEVRLDDLPPGITAEPVEVAADASEFTVTLRAAADAAPAEARPRAILTYELGDQEGLVTHGPLSLKVLAADAAEEQR
ncbi:hypothetical protein AB1L88_26705 [Tautonia sp. JC769]|uniref:COG1470 family protein n=1 Tax=Tautonia sp. JC769 TaxID=3232135 RepID=UPI00345A64FB